LRLKYQFFLHRHRFLGSSVSTIFLFFILFVEESEVVRIFLLFTALLFGIHLQKFVLGLLFLVGGSLFMVTHAVVTVISRKHSVAWLTVSSANVVWVFEA
jgi:hypothetical protein